MNSEERYICNQQKELYEYVYSRNIDIEQFSDFFLNSDFCNNSLDKPYSVDQFADIMNWLEFLEKEGCKYNVSTMRANYPIEAAGWCGFTYRQLQIETGLQSKDLALRVPFNRLAVVYPGMHTIDEEMAVDIIKHDFNLERSQPANAVAEEYIF